MTIKCFDLLCEKNAIAVAGMGYMACFAHYLEREADYVSFNLDH